MISYTIDPSVFIPPAFPRDSNEEKRFSEEINRYFNTIDKCYSLILSNEISIYVFRSSLNKFDDEYKRIVAKYSRRPVDMYKKKLENIILYNIPRRYGHKIDVIKYYFENWLEECIKVKYLKHGQSKYNPSLILPVNENDEFIKRINRIGILNNFIYKDSKFHVLIIKESIEYFSLTSENITFSLSEKEYNKKIMTEIIKTEHIDHLEYNSEEKFKSVFNVYHSAKNQFSDYIIFGNDVEKGIETIEDPAGPPDRISAYLKTLVEYCEYKKKYKNVIPDDIILNALGCICSYESERDINDEQVKTARMFDNGMNEKILFNLHLKPNTFSEYDDRGKKSRTVRIYISWDDNQKKVIVGWIGKHLYLPSKNP